MENWREYFSDENMAKPWEDGFEVPPAGPYLLRCDKVELGGGRDSDSKCFILKCLVAEGPYEGSHVYEDMYFLGKEGNVLERQVLNIMKFLKYTKAMDTNKLYDMLEKKKSNPFKFLDSEKGQEAVIDKLEGLEFGTYIKIGKYKGGSRDGEDKPMFDSKKGFCPAGSFEKFAKGAGKSKPKTEEPAVEPEEEDYNW